MTPQKHMVGSLAFDSALICTLRDQLEVLCTSPEAVGIPHYALHHEVLSVQDTQGGRNDIVYQGPALA